MNEAVEAAFAQWVEAARQAVPGDAKSRRAEAKAWLALYVARRDWVATLGGAWVTAQDGEERREEARG